MKTILGRADIAVPLQSKTSRADSAGRIVDEIPGGLDVVSGGPRILAVGDLAGTWAYDLRRGGFSYDGMTFPLHSMSR